MRNKTPSIKNFTPPFSKTPRIEQSLKNPLSQNPSWQFRSLDLEGIWGWKIVSKEQILDNILPKLKDFETMDWNNILGRNSHEIPVENLCKEAKKRLQELKHVDIENIVSLRLTGTNRLCGIRNGNTLKILWWDPSHSVCPSQLHHT